MPTVTVVRKKLFEALGEAFTDAQFDELCFEFGIELDEITSEAEQAAKEQSGKDVSKLSTEVEYKIEVPANRYDLLCLEGLARALRIFRGREAPPQYVVKPGPERIVCTPHVAQIRPHVVCAVLRNVTFTQDSYNSFIELQEKLHNNVCRRRTLVSIGTHDLDTVKGPFSYEALPPEEIRFVPLNRTAALNGHQLMEELEKDLHLRKYLDIIRSAPRYPVIYDRNRVVLSLPPIINGEHSKITLNTKNVFIEVTATDLTKAEIVLDTIVTMFAEYSKEKFTVESVEVVPSAAGGATRRTPYLAPRAARASVAYINRSLGLKLSADEIARLLTRMSLPAKVAGADAVEVSVPPTRSDVLQQCDIMEDVAIAYGFNRLPIRTPPSATVGAQQPLNKLSDLLRGELAQAGFTEVLTMALLSTEENYELLSRPNAGDAVVLANPKTVEYQIGRTTLIPGLLKSLASNKKLPLPLRIFELSDVMLLDGNTDVGARNERHLAAAYCNTSAGFELIHGLLDRVMELLEVPWKQGDGGAPGYVLQPSNDPAFFPGRCVDILLGQTKVGVAGVVHPDVLHNFELDTPVSIVELNIEPLLR